MMFVRRALALLYDALLLLALFFVVTGVAVALNHGEAIEHDSIAFAPYALSLWLTGLLFHLVFWRRGGQTLGMKAWQLRLVSTSGDGISVRQCIARYVSGTFLFGVVWLAALVSPDGRPLNDRLSATRIERAWRGGRR